MAQKQNPLVPTNSVKANQILPDSGSGLLARRVPDADAKKGGPDPIRSMLTFLVPCMTSFAGGHQRSANDGNTNKWDGKWDVLEEGSFHS